MSLTEAGQVFLVQAKRTLEQADIAAEAAKRAAGGEVGELSVGFFGPATYDVLPRILGTYRERYPGVRLRLHEWTTARQISGLRDGEIQVGFMRGPVSDEALVVESVFRERVLVALPQSHPLAPRPAVPLEMLARDHFVMVPRVEEPTSHDAYVSMCREAGFSPEVVQETQVIHTAIALVAAGVGVSLVPSAVRNLLRAGVVYRELEGGQTELETDVVCHLDDPSKALEAFLVVAREQKAICPSADDGLAGGGRPQT